MQSDSGLNLQKAVSDDEEEDIWSLPAPKKAPVVSKAVAKPKKVTVGLCLYMLPRGLGH